MSTERRYNEQEIAAIFKQAAQAQEEARQHMAANDGLTLEELQEIGATAGITPAFIEQAAAAVSRTGAPPPRKTQLGIPIGVARSVDLPGSFTEADWERLVVDLRDTFHARGKLRQDGSFYQWTNGNLQALVEPTGAGYRLRLSTDRQQGRSYITAGVLNLAFSLIPLLLLVGSGAFDLGLFLGMSILLTIGVGMLGAAVIQQPRWAVEREQQMDGVIARALERTTKSTPMAQITPIATEHGAPLSVDDYASSEEADTASPTSARRRSRS
jgi:hypothetical protein